MPGGGPVYQPTTASYEQQNHWDGPGGFLGHNGISRTKLIRWGALILGLICVAAGIVMIIAGGVDYSDTRQNDAEGGSPAPAEEKADVVVIVVGVIFLLVGLGLLGFYMTLAFRRRGCPCFLTKEQRMARALRSPQSVNGQGMNPSTDLLVTAQYAPVSEIAYQPPALSEEEETRKLMGSDNKDCLLKESTSVITLNQDRFEPEDSPAPRRLRNYTLPASSQSQDPASSDNPIDQPIKKQSSWKASIIRKASVRSKRAHLAGGDETTPSLRSSWSSVYYNDDPPSDSENSSFGSESV